jgi:hypothetical protein
MLQLTVHTDSTRSTNAAMFCNRSTESCTTSAPGATLMQGICRSCLSETAIWRRCFTSCCRRAPTGAPRPAGGCLPPAAGCLRACLGHTVLCKPGPYTHMPPTSIPGPLTPRKQTSSTYPSTARASYSPFLHTTTGPGLGRQKVGCCSQLQMHVELCTTDDSQHGARSMRVACIVWPASQPLT